MFSENFPEFPVGPHINSMAEFVKESRKCTFINCWHQSQHESAAMWRLYARERGGLAIKTDFASLAESLVCVDNIYIGEVTYLDYESASIKEDNAIAPFLFKRDSFEHEKEVRAIYWDITSYMAVGDSTPDSENRPRASGKYIEVDVSRLIKEVLVAPYAEDWFIELAQSVARRFGLQVSVSKSKLDQEPTWN